MKIPIGLFLTTLILVLHSCSTSKMAYSERLGNGVWSKIEAKDGSSPVARHEAAFVAVGEKFYLLGGRDIRPVSIYDTKTNTWSSGSKPPIEIHHFQPVVYEGKIYIIGAMTGGYPAETPVENILIYDPSDDSWTMDGVIPMDRARGGAGVVLDGHNIYLLCGIRDGHRGDHKNWLDRYDLRTRTWHILPDAPRARDHFQAIIADGKLFSVGGRTTVASDNPFKNTIREVDVYDLKSKSWMTSPHLIPTPRAGNSAILVGEEILIFGGESFFQNPAHNELEALNVHDLTWRSLSRIPEGRHGTGLVLVGNKIYTSSGSGNRGGGPELSDLYCFTF